ncbi:MAG: AbrB/MazE/SpoVT family DNA-binding domain-containing protein [Deltaproteobacteria bacterium]|nr:AbrB/MazE/SpoVT family DNA-binding domain-containing protein [Deltaproteobacteria bacterium]
MLAARMSSKGQMVIPKKIREELKIKPGAFFNVCLEKDNIILMPMANGPLDNLYAKFSDKKILDELEKEHANEIARENSH